MGRHARIIGTVRAVNSPNDVEHPKCIYRWLEGNLIIRGMIGP